MPLPPPGDGRGCLVLVNGSNMIVRDGSSWPVSLTEAMCTVTSKIKP